MRIVGLKILKNKLSEYVRLAAGGETIVVTDRSRVVAEITPPRPGLDRLMADTVLARGVREGWLKSATSRDTGPPPRKPVATFAEIMAELERDREDR